MIRIVVPIRKATDDGLYKTLADPNIPMFRWLRDNVGERYGDKDFYKYWRGINWQISGHDTESFTVVFADTVSVDMITLFKLRWL